MAPPTKYPRWTKNELRDLIRYLAGIEKQDVDPDFKGENFFTRWNYMSLLTI